jgi:hypothetical protein
MQTDRELLELAAKAAEIERGEDRLDCAISITENGRHRSLPQWNPLTDDGDALQLAVKLRIDLDQYADSVRCLRSEDFDDSEGTEAVENLGQDQYAATRRAIVRAAAEIGKGEK